MARECNSCEHFEGWEYDGGEPICCFKNGETCPFNDYEETTEEKQSSGIHITVEGEMIERYIRETILNTFTGHAVRMAENCVKQIINETYEQTIREKTESAIERMVDAQVSEFMAQDIQVGGGWSEPARTLSRKAYLTELIEKELGSRYKDDRIKKDAAMTAKEAIDSFTRKTRDEINAGIKGYFDQATRQTLTENVVSMLMTSDTYKKLSDSMGRLISDGK